jgi:hypothetical protein
VLGTGSFAWTDGARVLILAPWPVLLLWKSTTWRRGVPATLNEG